MKILLALLVFVSFGLAQSQPSESDAEKQKKAKELDEKVVQMLEQIIADAPTLRLAQNRAVVYGIAGDLYWKFDEKRAREIFRSCTGEILAANVEWDRDVKNSDNPFGNLYFFLDAPQRRSAVGRQTRRRIGPRNAFANAAPPHSPKRSPRLRGRTQGRMITVLVATGSGSNGTRSRTAFRPSRRGHRSRQSDQTDKGQSRPRHLVQRSDVCFRN